MPKYGVSFGGFATTTSVTTALKLVTTTAKGPVEIVELAMYGAGTSSPTDRQHQGTGCFCSAVGAGTGTASPPTPKPFRSTVAANSTILWKMSAEPTTYDATIPVLISFNQRGGMRWAVPQGEGLGSQFEYASMHFGWRVQSDSAGAVDGHMHFWEL